MTVSPDVRGAIRAEQLRLVLDGVAQSLPVGFILPTFLFAVLFHAAPHRALLIWYLAALAVRAAVVIFARRALRGNRDRARDRQIERTLMVLKIAEGLTWGSLLWIGLPVQIPAISILLMSLAAAICGNGVSLLSPLRYLYLALAVPLLGIACVTLWSLGGVSYRALALCCVLFVFGQYGQVRLANRRVREAIGLRYENLSLVERLRTEMDVARNARAEAEQANAAKSHFLAAASHDLRQPVHATGLFLHALGQTSLEVAQRRMVESAQATSLASADMLNALLDFSRLEAGVVTPKLTVVPLQPLLDKLERELAPLADEKRIVYRTSQVDLTVCSDPTLLELILRNLLLNAVRYTERGGVLIGCRRRGEDLSIEVYDTGIGIPSDKHDTIFREFHQLGNSERDRQKGLGLGLAIVRNLAVTLNHPLSLSSVLGRGSVFRLRVPLTTPPTIAPDDTIAIERHGLAGKTVLIVDDDAGVREAMLHLVTSWQALGLAAESWQEVIENSAADQPPDVIVCDYRLRHHETGAGAIERLRRFWQTNVPAMLVTGDTAPERLREAADSGIPLMHKPVPPDDLYELLVTLTAK